MRKLGVEGRKDVVQPTNRFIPLPDSVNNIENVMPAAALMTRSLLPLCETPLITLKVEISGQMGCPHCHSHQDTSHDLKEQDEHT